jgi:hypothetical protein
MPHVPSGGRESSARRLTRWLFNWHQLHSNQSYKVLSPLLELYIHFFTSGNNLTVSYLHFELFQSDCMARIEFVMSKNVIKDISHDNVLSNDLIT